MSTDALRVDGSLEQRDEIAGAVAEMFEVYQAVRDDYSFAKSVLANFMRAAGARKAEIAGYTFTLRPSSTFWCVGHCCDPKDCRGQHPADEAIPVKEVPVESYLHITRSYDK